MAIDAEFASDGYRAVQFTPPGRNTPIIVATGVSSDKPGSNLPITAWGARVARNCVVLVVTP